MMEEEPKWVETKKECEVNEVGNLIVRRVTLELEKKKTSRLETKDIIDLTLRFVGLAAIGLPVLLFFFQEVAEREKQRALFQIEIFSNVSTLLHDILENDQLSKTDFESKRIRVFYEYLPKIKLYAANDSLNTLLHRMNNNLKVYSFCKFFLEREDSVVREIECKQPNRVTVQYIKNLVDAGDKLHKEIQANVQRLSKEIPDKSTDRWKMLESTARYDSAVSTTLHKMYLIDAASKRRIGVDCESASVYLQQLSKSCSDELQSFLENPRYNLQKVDSILIQSNRFLDKN
jgi:hypothetical protein